MSMNFKRNDVQELIEAELLCFNIEQWASFKPSLEQWRITPQNIEKIKLSAKSDINSYFFKALQSFVQALHEISNKKYAWSIVKLYYTVFYLLRCEILLSNHIMVRCGTLYYAKVSLNEKMISFRPNKLSGDHQLTIGLEEKLYNLAELTDPILGNKIDGKNAYMWFLSNRERVNYQMKDYSDPICDVSLNHIFSYFEDKKLVELFHFYNSKTDYSICFDKDHSLLAIPYKKLISVYKRINSIIITNRDVNDKLIETRKLLFDLDFQKSDILSLIR